MFYRKFYVLCNHWQVEVDIVLLAVPKLNHNLSYILKSGNLLITVLPHSNFILKKVSVRSTIFAICHFCLIGSLYRVF